MAYRREWKRGFRACPMPCAHYVVHKRLDIAGKPRHINRIAFNFSSLHTHTACFITCWYWGIVVLRSCCVTEAAPKARATRRVSVNEKTLDWTGDPRLSSLVSQRGRGGAAPFGSLEPTQYLVSALAAFPFPFWTNGQRSFLSLLSLMFCRLAIA